MKESKDADMRSIGLIALGIFTIIVILMLAPFVFDRFEDATDIPDNQSAGVVITFVQESGGANFTLPGDAIFLHSELYRFETGVGAFTVTVAGGGDSAADSLADFVTEVNANSTYFNARKLTGNDTYVYTKDAYTGADANTWFVGENGTNITLQYGNGTLTGGVNPSDWNRDHNSEVPNPTTIWATNIGLLSLLILVLIVGKILVQMKK